jgi:hypothetical protein
MAAMTLQIKRIMDLTGTITYSLWVDGVLNIESTDLASVNERAETLKDGFKRGEFTEKVIYARTVNIPDGT